MFAASQWLPIEGWKELGVHTAPNHIKHLLCWGIGTMSITVRNQRHTYGWLSIALHWISAFVVIGLFAVGFYMTTLGYYDSLYRTLPHWHKSIGILFGILLVLRVAWRFYSKPPAVLSQHKLEALAAHGGHLLLYVMMFVVVISGYLISTADGRPIDVFSWFQIPAIELGIDQQEDIAGLIHEYVAYGLIALAILHALAAFKHYWIDKDRTLQRMLRPESPQNAHQQENTSHD